MLPSIWASHHHLSYRHATGSCIISHVLIGNPLVAEIDGLPGFHRQHAKHRFSGSWWSDNVKREETRGERQPSRLRRQRVGVWFTNIAKSVLTYKYGGFLQFGAVLTSHHFTWTGRESKADDSWCVNKVSCDNYIPAILIHFGTGLFH
jgi:hypothetical protein